MQFIGNAVQTLAECSPLLFHVQHCEKLITENRIFVAIDAVTQALCGQMNQLHPSCICLRLKLFAGESKTRCVSDTIVVNGNLFIEYFRINGKGKRLVFAFKLLSSPSRFYVENFIR